MMAEIAASFIPVYTYDTETSEEDFLKFRNYVCDVHIKNNLKVQDKELSFSHIHLYYCNSVLQCSIDTSREDIWRTRVLSLSVSFKWHRQSSWFFRSSGCGSWMRVIIWSSGWIKWTIVLLMELFRENGQHKSIACHDILVWFKTNFLLMYSLFILLIFLKSKIHFFHFSWNGFQHVTWMKLYCPSLQGVRLEYQCAHFHP